MHFLLVAVVVCMIAISVCDAASFEWIEWMPPVRLVLAWIWPLPRDQPEQLVDIVPSSFSESRIHRFHGIRQEYCCLWQTASRVVAKQGIWPEANWGTNGAPIGIACHPKAIPKWGW